MGKRLKAAQRRGLSRREFLATTTAAGLAIGLPPWLAGCGDDCDQPNPAPTPVPTATPTPQPRARERRTLHFDLSYAELEDLELQAFNSSTHRAALQQHTPDTRARFRADNPVLEHVADEQLTHFLEDVDLPADALQALWVTGRTPDGGEAALAGMHIHVPANVLRTMGRAAAAVGRRVAPSAKMRAYGIRPLQGQNPIDLLPALNGYTTPYDTAVALVFHLPEIMNLNLEQGSTILNLIETLPCDPSDPSCTPFLGTLAFRIAEAWPATESGMTTFNGMPVQAWAQLVPVRDPDGAPILTSSGKPAYRFDATDEIIQTAHGVAREVLKAIFDDAQFAGSNWHATEGLTVREPAAAPSGTLVAGGGTAGFAVTAEHDAGTTVHGIRFDRVRVTDQANRTVEMQVRNNYLRFVSTFVQFANESGDLPLANPGPDDTSRAKSINTLNANYTVLGIPLQGDTVEQRTFSFEVPATASKARVYFGSLGLGGEAFSPEAVQGTTLTLVFNIGLPTLFLAAGAAVGAGLQKSITGFLESAEGAAGVRLIVVRAIALAGPEIASGIYGTANSSNATGVLAGLGNALLTAVFSSGEFATILIQIGAMLISQNVADFFGPLGAAFKAVAVLADLATIVTSVGEVLASPAIFTNTLSLTMTSTVTISKDPDDFQFPARATRYDVVLTYDQASKLAHRMSGTIEPGRVDPIVVRFDGVPSGGMVTVDVMLTTDDDWLVGRSTDASGMVGPFGPIAATPATAGDIAITIKELLIPLTSSTRYQHALQLEYQNGQHAWVASAAPQATLADLCQGQDDRLCALTGITISQRTGMAGYGYQAGGQGEGVPFCGEVEEGTMYVLQNIFLGQNPDRGLKRLPCGFRQPAGFVYDRLGPADGSGRNFFVQPTAEGFFLQSIRLDETTPINLEDPLSWGRFSQPLDALAVHPMGFVVGLNRTNHKMEILQLPPQPVDASQAPNAVPFAVIKGGEGTRVGLLRVPVAVAVFNGAILVLEDGNARVQAFDTSANPVPLFANKTSSFFPLADAGAAVHLDLAVEGLGYMYVLSYINDGRMVADYRVDIYTPQGNFLARTTGIAAARLAVDTFRNVYTLNYATIAGAPRVEPSLSQWEPSTPDVS